MDVRYLGNCIGFEWDEGNLQKNWLKHAVSNIECEQCFFNRPFVIANDDKHSQAESRWFALGRTDASRLLFLVFTIRKGRIRIISSRDMNKKERSFYNEKAKT